MVSIKMSFNPEVAKVVGTDAAIILANIEFWQETNRANKKNFYDDKYWTYNSVSAFNKLFSYLSPGQIRRSLEKLEKSGYIVSGSFNVKGYDRTKWYSSVRDEYVKSICRKQQMDLSKTANGFVENDKPIPYNNTDNNTDSNILPTHKKIPFTKWTKDDFLNSVSESKEFYTKDLLNQFFLYWTEKSANGKMRFQLEKTWETSKRLITWKRNGEKFKTSDEQVNRGGSLNTKAL